jgi:hypothetical protein
LLTYFCFFDFYFNRSKQQQRSIFIIADANWWSMIDDRYWGLIFFFSLSLSLSLSGKRMSTLLTGILMN